MFAGVLLIGFHFVDYIGQNVLFEDEGFWLDCADDSHRTIIIYYEFFGADSAKNTSVCISKSTIQSLCSENPALLIFEIDARCIQPTTLPFVIKAFWLALNIIFYHDKKDEKHNIIK